MPVCLAAYIYGFIVHDAPECILFNWKNRYGKKKKIIVNIHSWYLKLDWLATERGPAAGRDPGDYPRGCTRAIISETFSINRRETEEKKKLNDSRYVLESAVAGHAKRIIN